MKKNKSLNKVVWQYFLLFSIIILSFLWAFQVLFLNEYYKHGKINDVKEVTNIVSKYQHYNNFNDIVNLASFNNGVCVQIVDEHQKNIYSSSYFGKGCFTGKEKNANFIYDFIEENSKFKIYNLTNPLFGNKAYIEALKLNDGNYAFINTSIEPIDSTFGIIRGQLIIVSVIVLILAFIISYFISKYISEPITKVSSAAKKLAKGEFNFKIDSDSDISELNELTNTLNYTSNELGKADELRQDLMANVSHDLKTPLTMIKAYAEMARDLHSSNIEKRENDMNTIIQETDRLTVLVNDILTLSKLQSDIETLNIEEFDLIILINDIIKQYDVYRELENYNFNFIHNKNKVLINADKKKIEQVIYNLINNAINYTGEDNLITIKVTDKENILIEIIDTGKGINPEDIPYIWDKYYKNKKKHKRNLIGTGLGLSIVKNILVAHNFEYGVKSKKDKGTNFYFIISKEKKINN